MNKEDQTYKLADEICIELREISNFLEDSPIDIELASGILLSVKEDCSQLKETIKSILDYSEYIEN